MPLHLPIRRLMIAALMPLAAFYAVSASAQTPVKTPDVKAAAIGPPVRQPGNSSDLNPDSPPIFEQVGPANYTSRYGGTFGVSAATGRVNAVAFDPRNSTRAYAATAGGGIWRTVNGGLRWTPVGEADFPTLVTSAVAVNPVNSQIVYAGMGDYNGSYVASEIQSINTGGGGVGGKAGINSYAGYGLMRSNNGGDSWTKITTLDVFPNHVSQILVDPVDPLIVTVSAGRASQWWGPSQPRGSFQQGGIWQSRDGGTSWRRVFTGTGNVSSLSLGIPDRNGVRAMYAGVVGAGVYRSDTNGATWVFTLGGYGSANVGNPAKVMVVASPTQSDTVYATNIDFNAVYRSDNKGQTWQNIIGALSGRLSRQSYTLYLAASKISSSASGIQDILYLGNTDIYALAGTNNPTAQWTNISQGILHDDQQYLAVSPSDPNQLLAANDGGIYGLRYDPSRRSYFYDGNHNRTLSVAQLFASDASASDSFQILGGGMDVGTAFTFGSILSWQQALGGDGSGVVVSPSDSRNMIASIHDDPISLAPVAAPVVYTQQIRQTQDGWVTNQDVTPDIKTDKIPFDLKMVIGSVYPHPVFFGTDNLWRLDQLSQVWTKIGSGLANNDYQWLSVMRADGQNTILTNERYRPGVIHSIWLAGGAGSTMLGSNHGDVQISETLLDTTITFIKIADPSSNDNLLPLRPVTAILRTGNNSAMVGIAGVGKPTVWKVTFNRDTSNVITADSQKNWVPSATGLPGDTNVNALYQIGNNIYAGTDAGLYRSKDGGATWSDFGTQYSLPKIAVKGIKYFPGTNYLMLTTYGRGVYRFRPATNDPL